MKLYFERHYPHPIDKVWDAVSTSEALEKWLMRNDFEAEIGRPSTFRFCASEGEADSLVHVTVEEMDPPRFMKWRWRHEGEAHDTAVTFELESTDGGTILRLRHSGEVSPFRAESLEQGWPTKLAALGATLS